MTRPTRLPSAALPPGPDVEWRRDRLLAVGFAPDLANRLATGRGVDLHAVLELVDRGCAPELAWRILAPLSDGGAGASRY
jgi:hypothetical protein